MWMSVNENISMYMLAFANAQYDKDCHRILYCSKISHFASLEKLQFVQCWIKFTTLLHMEFHKLCILLECLGTYLGLRC
jgi:hypothetical protein